MVDKLVLLKGGLQACIEEAVDDWHRRWRKHLYQQLRETSNFHEEEEGKDLKLSELGETSDFQEEGWGWGPPNLSFTLDE